MLGRYISCCDSNENFRPSAIVSVPCLDYASVIIASGIIVSKVENKNPALGSLNKWETAAGTAVCFPRLKLDGANSTLFLNKGIIDSIESYNGRDRLLVRWVDNHKIVNNRAVENRWLPLVCPIDEAPQIIRKKSGSILARNVVSLEKILGESGLCNLVKKSHHLVCLVDTKKRVIAEVKHEIPLSKFGLYSEDLTLALRDLVRLDDEGGEAMADTFCCRVNSEFESYWPATVIAGSLRFLRHWDDCDSPVRVAIISPTETNYNEAISFANNLYSQRASENLKLPDEILQLKPSSIDIQVMYER